MKRRNLIKKAAICMTAVMCLGGVNPAGIAGSSVYAATDEISEDVIGQYITQGYENPEIGFRIQLPEKYTLEARQSAVQLNEDQNTDVVEQSNSEGAYSTTRLNASMGQVATVFSSYTEDMTSSVYVLLQTPGIGSDHWEEESTVAKNTAENYEDMLRDVVGDEVEITDFETSVDTDEFAGKKHAIGMYKCKLNGVPFYGAQVYMRSDDQKYMIIADLQSGDPDELTNMESYFTAM